MDLNSYGQSQFIKEITLAEGYRVTEYVSTLKAIDDTHLLLRHRGPSALRLQLLLRIATGAKCFKVTSKQNIEHFDIVAVLSDGSFASSDPRTANYGMPCRDVLAVVINGYAELNTILHFHQIYQNSFVSPIKTDAKASSLSTCNLATNINENRCRVTAATRFETPEIITRTAWISEANLGTSSLFQFCTEDLEENKATNDAVKIETFKERVQKGFYSIKDRLKQGSKAAELFFQAVAAAQYEALEEAVARKNALKAQYGIAITNVVSTLKGSGSNKRIDKKNKGTENIGQKGKK